MAIDTKEKRANVPGVGRPWMRDKFPVATPDEQWRMASGLAYGGNALTGVQWSTLPSLQFTLPASRPEFTLPASRPEFSLPRNRPEFVLPEKD